MTTPATQFPDGRPLYEGNQGWALETISLNDHLDAETLRFRFTFFSDRGLRQDGFYFDDLVFEIIGDNFVSTTNVEHSIMTVSPNPSNDLVRVSMNPQNFKKNMTYVVYDITGRAIDNGAINRPQIAIDISSYNPGRYVVQVLDADQRISSTNFVKQ